VHKEKSIRHKEKTMTPKVSLGTHLSVIAVIVIVGWFAVSPSRTEAQSTGNKAVWNSTTVTGSTVWVDVSAFTNGAPDLCQLLVNNILTSTYGGSNNYPNGTIIDARGLAYGIKGIPCNENPFGALQGPPPSTTILLPSGYIDTNATWTLPNNTRIVGDEQGTIIKAMSPFTGTAYIIEMGSSSLCPSSGCTSVGIEHLQLGSGGLNVGGIDNQYSQRGSYVNDVILNNIPLMGLSIAAPSPGNSPPGATNSGPYSNIVFYANATGYPCIDLETQTKGIRGVTCFGSSAVAGQPAIAVNASNNSIENVHVEKYGDGVQIGNVPPSVPPVTVANVIVSNVTGSSNGNTINAVHICGAHSWNSSQFGICSQYSNCGNGCGTVQDVTVLHAANYYNSNLVTTTVADDASQNAIVTCSGTGCASPLSTGIYMLGEPDGGSATAYSKFTSSPATPKGDYNSTLTSFVPTWGLGIISPGSQYCSPVGAIYSQTNATGKSVSVCTPVQGQTYGKWATIP
jgi:hypothetical protein